MGFFGFRKKRKDPLRTASRRDIALDEVFLDSSNLPLLDPDSLEGRVVRPVAKSAILTLGILSLMVGLAYAARAYDLQIERGALFAQASENNRMDESLIFAQRGIIYDRNGVELAWNEGVEELPYALRSYKDAPGFAHLIGYVQYPEADASGIWWRTELAGVTGAEKLLGSIIHGKNGRKIVEVNAVGEIQREHMVEPPEDGKNVYLSIDADIQSKLHELLAAHADTHGFRGGAAAIMDVRTGELIALTSFPEYDQNAVTSGDSEAIAKLTSDPATPFLFRAVSGVYAPGSIVKPFVAATALDLGVITPEKEILSTGSLIIPNPYNPDLPSVFKDWRAHGWTDMRNAIAVSSDVYFYQVGGGYEGQQGIGISRLDAYMQKFGFGVAPGSIFTDEAVGVVPTPEWKEAVFDGDPWRLGDTYNTSIGQYGFQVSPLQAVRATAAIANGGSLMTPLIKKDAKPQAVGVGIGEADLQVVREGMRLAVTGPNGTVRALNVPGMSIAGKSGTAQTGVRNESMNSWVIGFWPYENPRYAFAVVLEKAPAGTLSGAPPAMQPFFYWLMREKPEYVY